MRNGAPDEVLAGLCDYRTVVSSWRGSQLLTQGLVVVTGRAVWSRRRPVKDSITFEVARMVGGTDWFPGGDPYHPLANTGQIIEPLAIIKSLVTHQQFETRLGRFRIDSAVPTSQDTVKVTAFGVVEDRLSEERLAQPLAPTAGGTFASELRRLMPVGLSAWISPLLVDRACPVSMAFSGSRLDAINVLLEAWPAIARPNGNGELVVEPPRPVIPVPTVTLSNGERTRANTLPIVVSAPLEAARSDIFNEIIVNGTRTDDSSKPPFQQVVRQPSGPWAADPAGFGIRTWETSSAAITTDAQALAVGQALLANSMRSISVIPVEMLVDPRWELDDPAGVHDRRDELTGVWDTNAVGYVEGIDMPLAASDGQMRMDVAVSA